MDDMQEYKIRIKENINKLIENNRLSDVKEVIKQYEQVVKDDVDMYSIKAVIAMKEGEIDEAERFLKKGLTLEDDNFDLLCNLGYVYQSKKQNDLAIYYYKKAFQNGKDEALTNTIYEVLQGLGVQESKQELLKKSESKTSIVILTYNNIEYNKLCIESIRKFTAEGTYEIIVVDNHSSDGTVEWLKEQKDLKLVLNNENLGFPKGCNQGIEIAERNNDILLLNNDTIVTPDWLKNLKKCLYSDEKIGAVGSVTNNCSYYQAIPVNYTSIDEMIKFAESFNVSDKTKWEQRVKLVGYCMLIKRNVLDKIGLLDERFTPGNFEDDDLSFRIQEAGYKLMLCNDTFIHHFGSTSFKKNPEKFNQLLHTNSAKFKEKWGFTSTYSTFVRNEIIDQMDSDKDEEINVLEVGCACGATLLKIKHLFKNASLYGIELDENSARIAQNFADIRAENIEQSQLSYQEGFFDYIIFADVLEHLYDPWATLKNIRKYLKPDGKVLASIPNVMHYSVIRDLLNGNWNYQDAGILDKSHIRFFTLKEIQKMFNDCEYVGLECFSINLAGGQEEEKYINELSRFTNEDLKQQYYTYQYLIKAGI